MRPEKELLKKEISEKIKRNNSSFILMHYAGLTANMANEFRREVGKMGGDVEVVRKRVLVKAAEDIGIKLDLPSLEGHIGLVFLGQDPLETTKAVYKFSNSREKIIKVRGGRLDGLIYSGEDVEKLSKLPSKEEMRAQFLSVLEAPLAQTLAVMDAALTSVIFCLDNKSKQGQDQDNG